VLAAVVSGLKCDVGDGHGAVGQKEGGMLEAAFVDVIGNGAVQLSGEQCLKIGFVNAGVFSDLGNFQWFGEVGVYVFLCFFEIIQSSCFFGFLHYF